MTKLKTYACALALYLGWGIGCASKTDSRICSEEELNNKNYVECSIEQSDYASCVFPKQFLGDCRPNRDFQDYAGIVKVSTPELSFIDMRYLNDDALPSLRKQLDLCGIQRLVLEPVKNPSGLIKALGSSKRRVCMKGSY